MSDITEKDVMEYCYSRNLMLVTKESLEYTHRPIVIETMNKNAIPVEWIKKYAKKGGKIANILFPFEIEMMLEDWEKENEYKENEK